MNIRNNEYIINGFTALELKSGCFRNWDGVSNILTYPFILKMSEYVNFNDVNVILDVGSRDACQALEFNRWFPNAKIYAFEPIESNVEWCKNVTKNISNIEIIPKAINSYNGKTKFFEVYNGNIGASSLLKVTDHSRSNSWKQREIEVDCVRLEDWLIKQNINKVDFMWADVQGAEKIIFESMGKFLMDVDGIATEIGLQKLYENGTELTELNNILLKNFNLIESIPEGSYTEADNIYINKKYNK